MSDDVHLFLGILAMWPVIVAAPFIRKADEAFDAHLGSPWYAHHDTRDEYRRRARRANVVMALGVVVVVLQHIALLFL